MLKNEINACFAGAPARGRPLHRVLLGKKTLVHLRVRDGNDAQSKVRNRDERGGRVDERYEIVEGLEVHDRRRDLHLRRVIHVQSEKK